MTQHNMNTDTDAGLQTIQHDYWLLLLLQYKWMYVMLDGQLIQYLALHVTIKWTLYMPQLALHVH